MTVRVDREARKVGRDLSLVITSETGVVRVIDRKGVVIPTRILRHGGGRIFVLEPSL
jgi:hypothetical protein